MRFRALTLPAIADRHRGLRRSLSLLMSLQPEGLRDQRKLAADLLDALGELVRAAQVDDLSAYRELACDGRIGLDHAAHVSGDGFAQRQGHSARPVHADQAV